MSRRSLTSMLGTMLCAALLVVTPVAWSAQGGGPTTPPPRATPPAAQPVAPPAGPTIDELQAEVARLQGFVVQAPEDGRAAITSDLDAAKAALDQGKAAEADRAEFERRAREAPALLDSIKAELATAPPLPGEVKTGLSETPTVAEVDQALAQANAEAGAAKAEIQAIDAEKKKRSDRLTKEIPDEITAANERRRTLLDRLNATPNGPDASLADQARRLRLQSELYAADRQIARLDAEQQSYLVREQLLPARKDRAQRRAEQADTLINALQTAQADARRRQAAKAAEEAARLKAEAQRMAETSPTLKAIAEENVELTQELTGTGPTSINGKLDQITRQITEDEREIDGIRDRFSDVNKQVQKGGLSDAIGVVLRRELEALKSASGIRAASFAKPNDVSNAQLKLVELEDRQSQLKDAGKLLEQVKNELPDDASPESMAQAEQIARDVIEQRRANLEALKDAYERYVDDLATLQGAEHELIRVSDEYRDYIEERILWVRSVVGARRFIDPGETLDAARWLFLSPGWLQAPQIVLRDALTRPLGYVGLVLLVVGAILSHFRARQGIKDCAEAVASFRTDHFTATVRAATWTVLLALPLPALIYCVGVALRLPTDQVPVALAAAAGLERVGSTYMLVEILRQLLRPGGLADVHFRWRKPGQRMVRANLAWFVPAMLPGLFVLTAMREQESTLYFETLGRISFIYLMLVLSVFAARVLSPRGSLIRPMLRDGGWMERLRFFWYPAVPGLPVLFAILSLLGYFYSAYHLTVRLRYSFWFILSVIVVHSILLRWLFIARRRLAVEQARKARLAAIEAARKQDEESKSGPGGSGSVDIPVEEKEVDIPSLDQQTRRFFRIGVTVVLAFGLFAIWSSVLPALNMLDRVQLWPRVQIIQLPASSIDPILLKDSRRAGGAGSWSSSAQGPGASGGAPNGAQSGTGAGSESSGAGGASSSSPSAGNGSPLPIPGMPGSSAPSESSSDEPVIALETHSITLADVGLAIIIAVITILAGRNLPGVLEISLLQRLPLDTGSRFAISTVASYAIFIVGITIALGAVDVGWSKIQWLAAALTFGLAFGLQEIFANFVSGLIILAERPVRVGDTVTVGNVSGTVTRIQMRATTITDWDRKELIVPNKAFITDQVINWSLSSTVLRVIVEVGIAYGSDVRLAEKLLYEAAVECQLFIDDPMPRVLFVGFGDNSLNFRVYGFIASIDNMLNSKSAMHYLINEKFEQAGIVIAFPQRDIHLDSVKPIEIRVVDSKGRAVRAVDLSGEGGDPGAGTSGSASGPA